MLEITSRDNQNLKFARNVRDGREKDFIFIEGKRLVVEALRSGVDCEDVFVSNGFIENQKSFLDSLLATEFNIRRVPDRIFRTISDTKTSQGIIFICRRPESGKLIIEQSLQMKRSTSSLVILLHNINNPLNLGAILRTSEATGVAGVITTRHSAYAFSPKAIRAAMGANFRIPIWANADFDDVLSWANKQNLISTCLDINSDTTYLDVDWKKSRLLIFGSEAHGLNTNEFESAKERVKIPMENQVESLNLAVSCGVILFEAKRVWESWK